jgi:glutathione peroxidase
MTRNAALISTLCLMLACGGSKAEAVDVAAAPPAASASLSALSLTRLDGTPLPADTLTGKAVLFVNVASKCGYTGQYAGLQALSERYADRGLVVVGVPSNQFGGQEPGTAEEIVSFCQLNYGVSFPLLEKQDVNGDARSPLYQWLVGSDPSQAGDIGWNFEKFLVSPDGAVVGRYKSKVTPSDAGLVAAIEAALPVGT